MSECLVNHLQIQVKTCSDKEMEAISLARWKLVVSEVKWEIDLYLDLLLIGVEGWIYSGCYWMTNQNCCYAYSDYFLETASK